MSLLPTRIEGKLILVPDRSNYTKRADFLWSGRRIGAVASSSGRTTPIGDFDATLRATPFSFFLSRDLS